MQLKGQGDRLVARRTLEAALAKYRAAIAADFSYLAAYDELARTLFALRRFDDAVRAFRIAIRDNPGYDLGWYNLAYALRRAGRHREAVAAYGDADRDRLLADARIIRNRLKVDAAIANARTVLELRASHGSFGAWLRAHHPRDKADWVKLFRRTFRFTGGEITGEFLMSIGYLPGAHHAACPVYRRIEALAPPWMA